MIKNVGKFDRTLRLIGAIVLAALIVTNIVVGTAAVIARVVAAALAVTAFVRFCPAYRLLGMSTCQTR